MVRKVTPAQFRAQMQQAAAKQRQAVNKYNAAVSKYNAEVKKAVATHNQNEQKRKRAIETYNREVRAHNARVRNNQARLRSELTRLRNQASTPQYTVVRSSSLALGDYYGRVDADADAGHFSEATLGLLDLAEGEAANSARVANSLEGQGAEADVVEDTDLEDELSSLSSDLDARWRGALYSLSPQNPDAARHFCTSAREVLIQMLDLRAPDADVLAATPGCDVTDKGAPTRRSKIDYLLARYGEAQPSSLGDFVDADVKDVLKLFRTFNDGTHGSAGTFDISTLRALKSRVEGAIRFVSRIIRAL